MNLRCYDVTCRFKKHSLFNLLTRVTHRKTVHQLLIAIRDLNFGQWYREGALGEQGPSGPEVLPLPPILGWGLRQAVGVKRNMPSYLIHGIIIICIIVDLLRTSTGMVGGDWERERQYLPPVGEFYKSIYLL